MKILTTFASKHGSTQEIAAAIAEELQKAGHSVDLYAAENAPSAANYDAAVIGSAIYMGGWMSEARDYVAANEKALTAVPVWLFSSGPLGAENPQFAGDPTQLPELMTQTGARDHQNFVGKLDKDSLGMGERLLAKAVKAPFGDFRDWAAIRAWAGEIAAALEPVKAGEK